jgi:hypothetical protein
MKLVLALIGLLAGAPLFGGTVITANLPANTVIVNIDARADGASGYDSDQAFWYSPFNASGNLLMYPVTAGTYTFRVVDAADAAQSFPALTSAQTNQIFTAWTFGSPWIENYFVFPSAATNHSSIPQIFDGAYTNTDRGGTHSDPMSAYNAVVQGGYANEIRLGGRDSAVFTNSYTFATATNIIFVIPDYGVGDNAGGVSVSVTKTSEDLAVNWFKVAGGGGVSSDGSLTVKGTAGQPDAGLMSDGTLTVQGGFWNVGVFQTPGLPYLYIGRISANSVKVFWSTNGNFTLQQNTNLANAAAWAPSGYSVTSANGTNSITISPPQGSLFFRLKQ